MGILGRVLKYTIADKRGVNTPVVKSTLRARDNVQAEVFIAPGDDSPPLPDDMGFFAGNSRTGGKVFLGAIDQVNGPEAEPGEKRLYARDSDGAVVATAWLKGTGEVLIENDNGSVTLKANGDIELNGDADNAVAFADLKVAFDQLKADFDAHTHSVPGVFAGAFSATAIITTPSTADIDPAKVDTVKLP